MAKGKNKCYAELGITGLSVSEFKNRKKHIETWVKMVRKYVDGDFNWLPQEERELIWHVNKYFGLNRE